MNAELFNEMGVPVLETHSRKTQAVRTRVSEAFRNSKGQIMFTSDVSARGMDYPDVSLVIQVGGWCVKGVVLSVVQFLLHQPLVRHQETQAQFDAWSRSSVPPSESFEGWQVLVLCDGKEPMLSCSLKALFWPYATRVDMRPL